MHPQVPHFSIEREKSPFFQSCISCPMKIIPSGISLTSLLQNSKEQNPPIERRSTQCSSTADHVRDSNQERRCNRFILTEAFHRLNDFQTTEAFSLRCLVTFIFNRLPYLFFDLDHVWHRVAVSFPVFLICDRHNLQALYGCHQHGLETRRQCLRQSPRTVS